MKIFFKELKMKKLLILTIIIVILFSCQMPDEKEEDSSIELKYDNGKPAYAFFYSNDNNYEYGIRFPYYYMMKNHVGKKIKAVKIYCSKVPTLTVLNFYQCSYSSTVPASEGNGGYPGLGTSSLLYSTFYGVTYAYKQNAWNTFNLSVPITIPAGKDIWVVADITAAANTDGILNYDTSSGHVDANYYRLTAGSGSWLNAYHTFNQNVMIRAVVE